MSASPAKERVSPPRIVAAPPAAAPPDLIRRERALIEDVGRLVAERAEAEQKARRSRDQALARAESEYQAAVKALGERADRLQREARAADEQRRRAIVLAALDGEAQAKADFAAASRRIAGSFDGVRTTATQEHARARAAAEAAHEKGQKQAAREHAEGLRPLDEAARLAEEIRGRLGRLAADYAKFGLDPEPPAATRETYAFDDPALELIGRLHRIERPLLLLEGLVIPKAMKGPREIWVYLVVVGLVVLLAFLAGLEGIGLGIAAAVGLVAAFGARRGLVQLSRRQLERLYAPLRQALADADGLAAHARGEVEKRYKEATRRVAAQRDADLARAKEEQTRAIERGEAARDEQLRVINERYTTRSVEVQTTQQRDLRAAIDEHDRRMAALGPQAEGLRAKLDADYREFQERTRVRFESSWAAMADRWRDGMGRVAEEHAALVREADGFGPGWHAPEWDDREFPAQVPPVMRLGTFRLDLAGLSGGLPEDEALLEGVRTSLVLPALRAFPGAANLLIEVPAEGRAAAQGVLQAAMFRLLTSLPPGRVRFTIVDPIGFGRGFGAFMHLADFDAALVNQRVWTDPREIEERLGELAAHMEMVAQKYLRNEYATIEEYNAVAGEVAEPYRVLVIADFPSKFAEKAAGRLAAIVAGGGPCGVLTLVAADSAQPMPPGFRPDDIRPHCTRLAWDGGKLAWDDPQFGGYPLALDPPPAAEFATRQIQRLGAAAKDARRVVVPFEFIAPPVEGRWAGDSRAGIDVPLGKSGATKRQHLTLGHGTSQHVLIAGRTGSGKSTLLHALITNVALRYSPDEVELYLIDFKKGVEFKVYATHELPQASVVAIESEREFGLSVLQRIDAEMRLRAERFREAGVQDIQGYRNTPGTPPLPRVLLVVDEFQEFFVEEDRLAQEAALLLDRLVRQGRAFGVHVHLGSQSLGGAFTLARSTLGQMAVRIALQCSEADSHLILSERNPAAGMLSRPGEAIYNDANGAPEGNHFFQVVWLPDERREAYLEEIRELARRRPPALARTPIVFEGDAAADITRNGLLRGLLEGSAWPAAPRSAQAWLGEAVAIKDPTAAVFRRQGGNHLLVVGQNEEGALGVMGSALLSLAAQFGPAASETERVGARFLVLDGMPEDHPLAGSMGRLAGELPHGARVGGLRDVAGVLAEVGEEVRRRQEGGEGPEMFLFVHDLARFRELRRREDDFGFSRRESEASPADHLEAILRDGPVLGVHLVVWCDTVNNLNRHFTHQALREFEMRALFQMSPTDSGHMLDSALASKLGPHRALFSSEEQNLVEKFRPYGWPAEGWVREVGERLRGRLG